MSFLLQQIMGLEDAQLRKMQLHMPKKMAQFVCHNNIGTSCDRKFD
jgi:hypothetical protein